MREFFKPLNNSFIKSIFLRRPWLAILALLSLVLGLLTYGMLGRLSYMQKGGHFVTFLLILDLACISFLLILIAKRLVKVWMSRREGKAGSRLHSQMVVLFGVIAAVPTLILTLFSAFFFHFGIQEWFDDKFSRGLENAYSISQSYFDEKKSQLAQGVGFTAQELVKRQVQWEAEPQDLQGYTDLLLKFSKFIGLVIYKDGKIIASSKGLMTTPQDSILIPWLGKPYDNLPAWARELVDEGHVAILENILPGFMGAIYKFSTKSGVYYILGWKKVQKQILNYALETQAAARDYGVLKSRKFEIQVAFSIVFAFVSLLILLGAIAVGLIFANALVRPISNLAKGVQRVSYGELDTFIPLPKGAGDLKILVKSFNNMVKKLRGQKLELLTTNHRLEERKVVIESVLEGVSSGVIELTAQGNITMINDNALKLLQIKSSSTDKKLEAVFPQAIELFQEGLQSLEGKSQGNITYSYHNRDYTFLVRFRRQTSHMKVTGCVLTFDDITEQISSERQAAWAEIARRVAHEIKNPLTPIQLSTERLKRRCLGKLQDEEADIFRKCTDVIIRQVDTIGSLVKEFSSFSKMPELDLSKENLTILMEEMINLQRQAYPTINFQSKAPDKAILIDIDIKKVTQVFNNLLKNAIESIQEANKISKKVRCTLKDLKQEVHIIVEDTGKGWEKGVHNRLVEPYFTTRKKGTGLGLSIVSRIIQDHRGFLYFEESSLGGAKVRVVLPKSRKDSIKKDEII